MDKPIEMPLKRKYRVGKLYSTHTAKPRTGSRGRKPSIYHFLHEEWVRKGRPSTQI